MKKIAITQRLIVHKDYPEIREALDINWSLLLFQIGFLPIAIPYEIDFRQYFENNKIDGILLTGGNDLSKISPNSLSKKRDKLEKEIIQFGIENKTPIFGVCRGLQIIADYFGSDLVKVENNVGIRHNLQVNKKSKYFNYLKNLEEVNSYHNYAVKNIADNLLISATDNNNIIKAIEHKHHKIFAQMWHSEREHPFIKNEMALINYFFNS